MKPYNDVETDRLEDCLSHVEYLLCKFHLYKAFRFVNNVLQNADVLFFTLTNVYLKFTIHQKLVTYGYTPFGCFHSNTKMHDISMFWSVAET